MLYNSFLLPFYHRVILFIGLLFLPAIVFAQERIPPNRSSNIREKKIVVRDSVLKFDTLSIVFQSFEIESVNNEDYFLDAIAATLVWKKKPQTDSVSVRYRVFPRAFNSKIQHMDFDSLILSSAAPIVPPAPLPSDQKDLINFGSIQAQGSFGREIGFGNNQNAVVNSNMNIQLSGFLADSIELQAAITDSNVPIQPDGNTQQLNEFDQVYVRFKKKNWQLNIGDLDIRESSSHFLSFYKRLQGLSYQTTNNLGKQTRSQTLISGSIAKGKFTRNLIAGLEGNQGPYRLKGANNEAFFIVLANTERVFIDGQILQRGEDQDYIINYNTAEVTFTPRRMITKDSRIQIEFEYADRNFLNTNLYATQEFSYGKRGQVKFGFFQNTDAKNSSINQVLDTRQKQFLAELGDSIQYAYYPSALLDSFAAGKILYEIVYDTINNVADSFYRYSSNPEKALYNLSFTKVGVGKGRYLPETGNANGKVFRYVGSENGILQGSFEPVVMLVAPKKQQVMNLEASYHIAKNTLIKTELAMSNNNVNTFSRLNKGDDKGFAARVHLTDSRQLRSKNELQLLSAIGYEYVQDLFTPLERLRNVEFTRDWGLPLVSGKATENIFTVSTGLKNNKGNLLEYKAAHYNRSDQYNGFQNSIKQYADLKNWRLNNEFVLTNYATDKNKGYFLRPIIDISRKLPWLADWRIGGRYALEENYSKNKLSDTLTREAFSFDTYTAFLKSDESKKNRYGIGFYTRSDKYPVGKNFIRGDRSYNLNLQADVVSSSKRQFYLNTTFRSLKVYNKTVSSQKVDNTVLGRAEYVMNEWKGMLTGNVLYEVGSGQEQKREFAYLEVPAGTGLYAWIDYNEDGVQQLNEFELAVFKDQAKYIRIYTPTNEYVKANYTTLNYSLTLQPKLLWSQDSTGWKRFFSRLIFTSSLQISKKEQSMGLFEFNPFQYQVNDTSLITLSTMAVNTLSFNRESSVWGWDLSNIQNITKALLTYGYENRSNNDWVLKYRHSVSRSLTLNVSFISGNTASFVKNAQFDNRNYDIVKTTVAPSITYVSGTTFRLSGGYGFENKKNAKNYGGESVVVHRASLETKYNILQNSAIGAKFAFESLNYSATDKSATTISYVMLNGLMPGSNYLWNVMVTKRLMNNLELNFQYDGRKAGNTKLIHTGRATLTAIF